MVSKGSAPQAPDPKETAAAQTSSNRETAIANANLNRVDQYSPYGSSTYSVIGTNDDGTPKYRQDINLAPDQQQLLDMVTQGQKSLGSTGLGLLDRINQNYQTPFDTSMASQAKQEAQDAAYRKNTQYLDPQFATDEKSLQNSLINQGITQGSEAANNAQGVFDRRKQMAYSDARDAAIAQGNAAESQYLSQLFALRNQPLNEYNALMSGSQVTNPTFNAVPTASQANTDVAGITNNAYQQQMQAYNAKQQGLNNLFSLGGTLGSALILR